jgi:hypothetical protein
VISSGLWCVRFHSPGAIFLYRPQETLTLISVGESVIFGQTVRPIEDGCKNVDADEVEEF